MLHELAAKTGRIWIEKRPVGRPKKEVMYKPDPVISVSYRIPKGYHKGNEFELDLRSSKKAIELADKYGIHMILIKSKFNRYIAFYKSKSKYMKFLREFFIN